MESKKKLKIGVIGLGMGAGHVERITKIDSLELIGVCDINKEKADEIAKKHNTTAYYDHVELFEKSGIEAVIIATPHFDHTPKSIEAFKKGIHVLVEKPVGVHVSDVKKTIDAYTEAKKEKPDLVFAAMFNMRTSGNWKKIKDLIDSNELGKLVRATWIITDWFRTQYYYDSGGWRATWKGEGGGVLLNQCPHQLDLYQWFFGLPDRIRGFATLGKYHNIEVEDEVTAYFEYDSGMVGHFITSTGESPGTNRLEIIGENGKLVYEDDILTFFRNRQSMFKEIKESKEGFTKVENWQTNIPYSKESGNHAEIIENFGQAILNGDKLIADACEGMNSVMIGNAILLSSMGNKTISTPVAGPDFDKLLDELIKKGK